MSKKLLLFIGIPLGLILLLIAGFLVAAMSQPDELKVTRSIVIDAAPAEVFPLVNDLHQWEQWSPWFKQDPDIEIKYSGPDAGEGAAYEWKSEIVGAGTMEIVESVPDTRIKTALHFTEPFEDKPAAAFEFEPVDGGTKVTWTMEGESNLTSKVMMLFWDFDAMIGKDFENGLNSIKQLAESGGSPAPEDDPAAASDADPSPGG